MEIKLKTFVNVKTIDIFAPENSENKAPAFIKIQVR